MTLSKKGGGPSQGAIARETSLKDDLGGAGRPGGGRFVRGSAGDPAGFMNNLSFIATSSLGKTGKTTIFLYEQLNFIEKEVQGYYILSKKFKML